MKAIGSSLSSSLNSLNSATNAAKAATALTAVQTDLRAAADRIDAITPPKPVKTEHAKLEKGVRDFADELTPVIAKLKAGTMSALSAVGTLKGLQEIQTASGAIANKGYKIGG
jgi:soluble cytochrome b562